MCSATMEKACRQPVSSKKWETRMDMRSCEDDCRTTAQLKQTQGATPHMTKHLSGGIWPYRFDEIGL